MLQISFKLRLSLPTQRYPDVRFLNLSFLEIRAVAVIVAAILVILLWQCQPRLILLLHLSVS